MRRDNQTASADDTLELDESELSEAELQDDDSFPDPETFGGRTYGASSQRATAARSSASGATTAKGAATAPTASGARTSTDAATAAGESDVRTTSASQWAEAKRAAAAMGSRSADASEASASDSDQDTSDTILPPSYRDGALADAVGAPRRYTGKRRRDRGDDGSDDDGRKGRRGVAIVVIGIVLAVVITVSAFIGRANSQRFFIACSADRISAEQGRTFPPWGSKPLNGSEWKPIALPPNAECKPRESETQAELEGWYLDLLLDRASTTLTRKNLLDAIPGAGANTKGGPNPLDVAAEQLNQALLLSRAPERRDQRKEVERLLGDVQYWRAALRLRDANAALVDAARQFETASAQRPRHVTDAAAWSTFLHRIVDDLRAGPGGASSPATVGPPGEKTPAPMGSALPPEPPAQGSGSDATDVTPDAGLPTGGVLL